VVSIQLLPTKPPLSAVISVRDTGIEVGVKVFFAYPVTPSAQNVLGRARWMSDERPDGTIVWTTPAGLRKHVPPRSRVLFPDWNTTTAVPTTPQLAGPPTPGRELTMPLRARTRAQQRRQSIRAERARNHQRDLHNPPPY
jgi:hypothetical protein